MVNLMADTAFFGLDTRPLQLNDTDGGNGTMVNKLVAYQPALGLPRMALLSQKPAALQIRNFYASYLMEVTINF